MSNFLQLLLPPGDRANLSEMALLKQTLPARITSSIPSCMYAADKQFDYEAFIILAWVIASRENPDITIKEVGDLIGFKEMDNLREIEKRILYFYTRQEKAEIEEKFKAIDEAAAVLEAAIEAGEASEERTDVNPQAEEAETP